MKSKKFVAILMIAVLLIMQSLPIYASEEEPEEWYELIEEDFEFEGTENAELTPYTMYLVNVTTSIIKLSSTKIGMRADVYCSEKVKTINITFYLQKLSGSTWKTVGTASTSASDVNSTYKSVTASNVASGTYRVKATAKATDYSGYSESLTGYSGSINLP